MSEDFGCYVCGPIRWWEVRRRRDRRRGRGCMHYGIGRSLAVRITARYVRPCEHGRQKISDADMLMLLARAYRHRDAAWRMGVLEDAQARNRARMAARG